MFGLLLDPQEHVAVSSLGWVDGGTLWCLDLNTMRPRSISLGSARYLELVRGADGYFGVVQHFEGNRIEITVHRFDQLPDPVGRLVVQGAALHLEGSESAWTSIPGAFVAYMEQPAWSDFGLIKIDPRAGVSVQPFNWYDDQYDKGYQGIVGVTEIPGKTELIVSVQRSSTLILHDPVRQMKVGEIRLSDNSGNPTLRFRSGGNELWVADYDTLIRLDPSTWNVIARRRLQTAAHGTQQFIGEFGFALDEEVCTVARPYSGDVIAVGPRSLRIRYRARVGRQPLEALVLGDRKVIARDWKTGDLLIGELRRAWHL